MRVKSGAGIGCSNRHKKTTPLVQLTMCRLLLVFAAFFSSWCHASAQMIGDERCKQSSFVNERVELIITATKEVAEAIEMVPPHDADYIRRETQAALDQKNEVRYSLVQSQPFYYPLMFHDLNKVLDDNLRAAVGGDSKKAATHLVVSLSQIGDVQAAMGDYIRFDRNRRSSVLTKDMRQRLYFLIPVAKGEITSLLQCVISQL